MLKNVAIPLMLAASEAEAQKKLNNAELEDALAGDRKKPIAGLLAGAEACTVASSTAEDNISNLDSLKKQAETDLTTAKEAVDALVADGTGAWALANTARKAAVEAAEAQEAAENIATLLDQVDDLAGKERAEAAKFVAADRLYQDGKRLATASKSRLDTATGELARLAQLKDDAANAVIAVKAEVARETLWRGWRYCELGGTVQGDGLTDWWTRLDGNVSSLPATCTVPEDPTGCGADNNVTCVRPNIVYHTAVAGDVQNGESEDGTKKYTATLAHTIATNAETATTAPAAMGALARTAAGIVAWREGDLRRANWLMEQRATEQAVYTKVVASITQAKISANKMGTDAAFDIPALTGDCATTSTGPGCLFYATGMGTPSVTAVTAQPNANPPVAGVTAVVSNGATKALDVATTGLKAVRDSATDGSGKHVPGTRSVDANGLSTWEIKFGDMDTWDTTNNASNPSAVHTWWVKARDVSVAASAWHTQYTSDGATEFGNTPTVTAVACANDKDGTAAADTPCACKVDAATTDGGTWAAKTDASTSDKAACKTHCITANQGLLVNKDTSNPTVDNGGNTMGVYASAVTTWCGAYSWANTGTTDQKCYILSNADDAVKNDNDQPAGSNTDDVCEKMTNIKGYATKQGTLASAWAALTNTLHTNMVSALEGIVTKEKNWMQGWYLQQYWVAINTEMDATTAGSKALAYTALLDGTNLGNTSVSAATGVIGSAALAGTAQSDLTTAQENLAKLQAATATAQAVVTALGTRILRADAQIAQLNTLVNTNADGTLDEAAALRLTDWTEYNNGEFAAATSAKSAADTAVAENTGQLWIDQNAAKGLWDTAKNDATGKEGELTTALSGADLVALRATVESDTKEWDKQQTELEKLEAEVVSKTTALETAQGNLDQAVLDCQIAAYDSYRTTLETLMEDRAKDLQKIKDLLAKKETPAPGTLGARCEKALSNGTFRPQRGEMTCAETLCCGASRIWMASGDGIENSMWRTIETCQLATDTKFAYTPARPPMATTMPATIEVDFACIEGAKKLAAAASAVAAAVYMLA